MSAALLLAELRQAGADVGVDEEGVYLDAPVGALAPQLVARFRVARPALLALLSPKDAPPLPSGAYPLGPGAALAVDFEAAPPRCPDCAAGVPNLLGLTRCACCALERGAPPRGSCRWCARQAGEAARAAGVTDVASEEPGALVDVPAGGRSVVHPLCCGGCGCTALTDGGRGPCARCGWCRAG